MATPKLLLRTKTSAAVAPNDLLSREMVFGENEKSLFYKTVNNNIVKFLYSDDTSIAENNAWSSQKISDSIDTSIINIHQILVGDTSIAITDTGMNGLISLTTDGYGIASFNKDGLKLGPTGARVNEISTDILMTTNSDTKIVTEKAVKGYVDGILNGTRMTMSGRSPLINGNSYIVVAFDSELPNTNYTISTTVINLIDATPSIFIGTVVSKTTNGFTVDFNGEIDSNNYLMEWILSDKTLNSGSQPIVNNTNYVDVYFTEPKLNTEYSVDVNITNLVDALPSIYDMTITQKSTSGFTITFSGYIDSSNYILEWMTDNTENKSGQSVIPTGTTSLNVVFAERKTTTNYIITTILVNTIDVPVSIYSYMITNKTLDGFTVLFSDSIDSANYIIDWVYSEMMTRVIYQDGSVGFNNVISGIDPFLPEHLATKRYVDNRILSGRQQILIGEFVKIISLPTPMSNINYTISVILTNVIDDFSGTPDINGWVTTPVSYDFMITGKTMNDFTITFSAQVDSNNYYIEWFVKSDTI